MSEHEACYKVRGAIVMRTFACIGHAQPAGAVVLQLEVLVGELLAIDAAAYFEGFDSVRHRLTHLQYRRH